MDVCLSTNIVLKLNIFKAHGITEDPKYSLKHEYVWKGFMIMGGAYLFYLVERIMKILISVRKVNFKTTASQTQ